MSRSIKHILRTRPLAILCGDDIVQAMTRAAQQLLRFFYLLLDWGLIQRAAIDVALRKMKFTKIECQMKCWHVKCNWYEMQHYATLCISFQFPSAILCNFVSLFCTKRWEGLRPRRMHCIYDRGYHHCLVPGRTLRISPCEYVKFLQDFGYRWLQTISRPQSTDRKASSFRLKVVRQIAFSGATALDSILGAAAWPFPTSWFASFAPFFPDSASYATSIFQRISGFPLWHEYVLRGRSSLGLRRADWQLSREVP